MFSKFSSSFSAAVSAPERMVVAGGPDKIQCYGAPFSLAWQKLPFVPALHAGTAFFSPSGRTGTMLGERTGGEWCNGGDLAPVYREDGPNAGTRSKRLVLGALI